MLFMKRNENFKLRDNASCCQIKVYGFLHLSLFMLVYITCTFMLLKAIYRCSIKTFCNKMLWSTTFKRDNVFPDQPWFDNAIVDKVEQCSLIHEKNLQRMYIPRFWIMSIKSSWRKKWWKSKSGDKESILLGSTPPN